MGSEPPGRGRPFLTRRLDDPELKARVEAAERLGISLRRFDGWEPERVTEYEYDGDRLIRSITTSEPEWDDEQQGWMLALAQHRAVRCPGCGRDRRESTDIANDGRYRVLERRCHACTALSIAAKKFADNPQSEALLYHVERR